MRGERGLTIIEVLVVIAIIAILGTLAIPNYVNWVTQRRLQSAASNVQDAIQLAKMTAIKENANVTITFNPGARSYTAVVGARVIRTATLPVDISLTTSFAGHQLVFDGRGFSNAVAPGVTLTHPILGTMVVAVGITGSTRVQ